MRTTLRWSILACGVACALIPAKAQNAGASPLPRDVREAFAWYETLGYPSVSTAGWVGVLPDEAQKQKDSNQEPILAFLLRENEDSFTVLTSDLGLRSFAKKKAASKERTARWEPRTLEADVRGLLTLVHQISATRKHVSVSEELDVSKELDLEARKGVEKWAGAGFLHAKFPLSATLFVMAHACHEKNLPVIANELCTAAKRLTGPKGGNGPTGDLTARVEADLGHAAMWRAVEATGGIAQEQAAEEWDTPPLPTREELLTRFRDVVRLYPRSEHVPRAKAAAAMLESMVAEDKAHVAIADEVLTKLPVEAQVRELIFRLRDQRSALPGGGYGVTLLHDSAPLENKNSSPVHHLVQIGLPAVPKLIEALDDKRFTRCVQYWRSRIFSHEIVTTGQCAEVALACISGRDLSELRRREKAWTDEPFRKLVEAWWTEVQVKGERQALIDNITSGHEPVGGMVTKLRQKWPEALPEALLLGAQNASDELIRKDFIGHLAGLENGQATSFLLKEMRQGSTPALRVAAAEALQAQGHTEAVPAMLEEWRKLPRKLENGWDTPFDLLLHFLMKSPSVPVIQALATALPQRSLDERIEIIMAVAETHVVATDMETLRAIEYLLVHALDDSQVRLGSESNDDFDLEYPHPGDYALFALHRHFPQRYSFSNVAGRRQRDRERGVAINQWRATQGLPARTLPLNNLSPLPPQQSLQIVEVRIESSPGISERVRKSFENLKGTAFNPALFTETATDFANSPGNGGGGLALEAYRESDLKGVSVIVTALPPRVEGSEWVTSCGGKIGSESIGYGEGAASAESLRGGLWWNDFLQETAATLEAAAPTDAFLIVLSLECPQ